MVSLSKLVFLATYINGALASGRHDRVSVDDVLDQVEDGHLFDWIERTVDGTDIHLSPLALYSPSERAELNAELAEMATAELSSHWLDSSSRGLALIVSAALLAIGRRVDQAGVLLSGDRRHRLRGATGNSEADGAPR